MGSLFGLFAALFVLYVERGSALKMRSECEPEYRIIPPECGTLNLKVTASTSVVESPSTFQSRRRKSLRSCVWTAKAAPGSSIILLLQVVHLDHNVGCWPEYVKIYQGLENQNYDDEIFSTCRTHVYEGLNTGSHEITIVLQVLDTFEDKKIIIKYYSQKNTEEDDTDLPSKVVLSFEPIKNCVNATEIEESRSLKVTDDNRKQIHLEVNVFVCVYPKKYPTLTHLSSDTQNLLESLNINETEEGYNFYIKSDAFQTNGNCTFTVAAGNKFARIRFEILYEYAPTVDIEENIGRIFNYRLGYTYFMECSFSAHPFLNASFFIFNVAHVQLCRQKNLPPVEDWERLSTDFFNKTINSGNVLDKVYYDCDEDLNIMKMVMVANTSGCLVCWARNDFGYGSFIKPMVVTAF